MNPRHTPVDQSIRPVVREWFVLAAHSPYPAESLQEDTRIGGPHSRVWAWYEGTIDLSLTDFGDFHIYRGLADRANASAVRREDVTCPRCQRSHRRHC